MSNKDDIARKIGIGQSKIPDKLPPLQDYKVTKIYPPKPTNPVEPPTPFYNYDDCDSTD